jgi:tetratricopeptide (TPR) repeat protein/DNA-binding CsgD family transcriptional regulator
MAVCLSGLIWPDSSLLAAKPDSLAVLSEVRGADMTLYDLYADNLGKNRDAAMEYAVMFLERIDSTAVNPTLARMYDSVSEWYEMDKFLFSKAIAWRERSMASDGALGDEYLRAKSEFYLAKLHLKRSEYDKTLRYAIEAVATFHKFGATIDEMECNKLLGVVYEACHDYERSDEYFREYAKAARLINDSVRLFIGLNNTAAFASSIGDNDKTARLLEESIQLARRSGDTAWLSKLYINAVVPHIASGEWDRAEEYLALAYPLCDDIERLGHYWLNYGMLYEARGGAGDTDAAIDCYEKAADYYGQGEFNNYLEVIYASLNELYRHKGDTASACRYLQAMHDIEAAYDRDGVFLELFRVRNEIERKRDAEQLEADRSRMLILWISLLSAVAVTALIVILLLRKRASRIKSREMEIADRSETSSLNKMHQFRMDRIIEDSIDKLTGLLAQMKNGSEKEVVRQVTGTLRDSRDEEHLKELREYVLEFDSDFFRNLVRMFPDLTVNESRLCVLLNRNLATKQIAEITRQSPESINVARTRLRKKLGISGSDISIQEFLKKYNFS